MYDASLGQALLENLERTEQVARVGMAICFGLSLFTNGLALQWRNEDGTKAARSVRAARACYLVGTGFTVAFCTAAFVSPSPQVANLVVVGVAMVLAIITLALDRGAQGAPALSFLSGAVIWLLTVVTPFLTNTATGNVRPFTWLSGLHITTAIAGEALCVLAFCASLLYLWDYRRLKTKVLEKKPVFPSLDTLDKWVGGASSVGLLLISTSLVSGIALVLSGSSLEAVGPTKIVWAFAVWGWYVLAIFGRGFLGWRGRRGAQLSLWGIVLILCTLFGTVWNLAS